MQHSKLESVIQRAEQARESGDFSHSVELYQDAINVLLDESPRQQTMIAGLFERLDLVSSQLGYDDYSCRALSEILRKRMVNYTHTEQ